MKISQAWAKDTFSGPANPSRTTLPKALAKDSALAPAVSDLRVPRRVHCGPDRRWIGDGLYILVFVRSQPHRYLGIAIDHPTRVCFMGGEVQFPQSGFPAHLADIGCTKTAARHNDNAPICQLAQELEV